MKKRITKIEKIKTLEYTPQPSIKFKTLII